MMYETSAIVEEQGKLHLDNVPFAPGTEVEVLISPRIRSGDHLETLDDRALTQARDRLRELFRTIKGFRNTPRLSREELYDRGRVR